MADIFDQWDSEVDKEQLAKDVEEAAQNSSFDAPVPPGKYIGFIKEMELKPTKNNDPMLAVQFKILEGDFKNKILFMNFVMKTTVPFLIAKSTHFLSELDVYGDKVPVKFDGSFRNFKNEVDQMFKDIQSYGLEFELEYTQTESKGQTYDNYKVLNTFEPKN
nr:DUF669 domain-containing protein [uncultured Cellulosilyticum sp.]